MGVLAPAGAAGQRLDRKTLTPGSRPGQAPTVSHRTREEEALPEWWGVCERAAFGGGELGVFARGKSFFQKTLEVQRGAFLAILGCDGN